MGLAERLEAADLSECYGRGCTTCLWYAALPEVYRKAFDDWVDAGKSVRGLWKLCVEEGIKISCTPFRDHVANHHPVRDKS